MVDCGVAPEERHVLHQEQVEMVPIASGRQIAETDPTVVKTTLGYAELLAQFSSESFADTSRPNKYATKSAS